MNAKEEKSTWDKLKKKVKSGYEQAKIKWGEIKEELEDSDKKEPYSSYGQKPKKNQIPSNKLVNLKCPICGSKVPKELITKLKTQSSVICEKCGFEIDFS